MPSPANGRVPLTQLEAGKRAVMAGLSGGRKALYRMVSLGFTPGVELLMIQNFGHGPLIVQVRDARIALGRGEAGRILVVPQPWTPE
jgi:ferrous iron transport protein A